MFNLKKAQDDLKSYLLTIGICASDLNVVSRSDSHYSVACDSNDPFRGTIPPDKAANKIVPFININVCTNENYLSLGIDRRMNNWQSTYSYTDNIRKKWSEILGPEILNDYYDKDMLILFENAEMCMLTNIIYDNCKEVYLLLSTLNVVMPRVVFCCSTPGYNIIYHNKNDYDNAKIHGDFTLVNNTIIEFIIKKYPKDNISIVKESMKIDFYHPEMKEFNFYSLSRHD